MSSFNGFDRERVFAMPLAQTMTRTRPTGVKRVKDPLPHVYRPRYAAGCTFSFVNGKKAKAAVPGPPTQMWIWTPRHRNLSTRNRQVSHMPRISIASSHIPRLRSDLRSRPRHHPPTARRRPLPMHLQLPLPNHRPTTWTRTGPRENRKVMPDSGSPQ